MLTVSKTILFRGKHLQSHRGILNSGCIRHMSNRRDYFTSLTKVKGSDFVRNNNVVETIVFGDVKLKSVVKREESTFLPKNVLCTPWLTYSAISLSQTRKKGFKFNIDNDKSDPFSGPPELVHKDSGSVRSVGVKYPIDVMGLLFVHNTGRLIL